MELVVRMRRYMRDENRDYTVGYIPDPLCWTEAPESWKILSRQRNRWTRGTIETLLKHKKLFFNPKHGLIGLLSYPYWFFFEWLAPLLEAFGLTLFFLFAITGLVNWSFFFLMIFLVYGFTICFSVLSLLIEEVTYHQYKKTKDIFRLLQVGLLEPLFFHPFVVYAAVKGNIDFILGKSNWCEMSRKGFAAKAPAGLKGIFSFFAFFKKLVPKSGKKVIGWTRVAIGVLIIAIIAFAFWFYVDSESSRNSYKLTELIEGTSNDGTAKRERRAIRVPKPGQKAGAEDFIDEAAEATAQTAAEVDAKGLRAIDSIAKAKIQAARDTSNKREKSEKTKELEHLAEVVSNKVSKSISSDENESSSKQEVKKEANKAPQPETKKAEVAKTQAPKTEAKKTETPKKSSKAESKKAEDGFYVIAGSYTDEKLATKRKVELESSGFKAEIVPSNEKYRVAYQRFNTKEEALALREKLISDENIDGIWVLTVQ